MVNFGKIEREIFERKRTTGLRRYDGKFFINFSE